MYLPLQIELLKRADMLGISIFFFSHNVFYLLLKTLSRTNPVFLRVCIRSLLKTLWKKEKLLIMNNFSFSHCIFHPFLRTFRHFLQNCNCSRQTLSVWNSLQFVVWERVNNLIDWLYWDLTPL